MGWLRLIGVSQRVDAIPATPPNVTRDRWALVFGIATLAAVSGLFAVTKGTTALMPGPLTSAHGSIEKCSTCHTQSGDGKLSWVRGLTEGDPHADGKACLTCHKMPETAFNAHGTTTAKLEASTARLTQVAAKQSMPQSARAQDAAFPAHDMATKGLTCATCHQEHQGATFKLNKISNEQCRSCHVVKFDGFDGGHPAFEAYPFKTRTRLIYDHTSHFAKHYPELAKKEPGKTIPATCSTCHNTNTDKRVMSVAPFEKACASCHLDQITGKERASGPKGIAFLSLPGLDLETLRKKNAGLGEWPEGSEAQLTPFMKVMISRSEKGRAALQAADALNLQDLEKASDPQIKAVTDLAWEIKRLIHALIAGKASDVLADLNMGTGGKLSAALVSDLTANIPRDVVLSAQQQWLPNLGKEIESGPIAELPPQPEPAAPADAEPSPAEPAADNQAPDADPSETASTDDATEDTKEADKKDSTNTRDPPACVVRVLGQCMMYKDPPDNPNAALQGSDPAPANTEDAPDSETKTSKRSAEPLPGIMNAGAKDAQPAAAPGATKAGGQADELLFPTEDEKRAMQSFDRNAGKAAPATGTSPNPEPPPGASSSASTPVITIDSGVDPETWADTGGWYRQDHAIFYRPSGHKDKFIYTWLFLTGPKAAKGDASPVAAVFDSLTAKDAQGSCTKCHSVDDIAVKGRAVNFGPLTAAMKQGRFTRFLHEPHFGTQGDQGCLTCHNLQKTPAQMPAQSSNASSPASPDPNAAASAVTAYLKSYDHGDPHAFTSNFGVVKKDQCQSCHTASKARQDCLTCHQYHVDGIVTPITATKNPIE
jgi:hypothetical protein